MAIAFQVTNQSAINLIGFILQFLLQYLLNEHFEGKGRKGVYLKICCAYIKRGRGESTREGCAGCTTSIFLWNAKEGQV